MVNTRLQFRNLIICLVAVIVLDPGTIFGQSHFPYRARNHGQYSEGQRSERPISGIDIKLISLGAIPAANAFGDSTSMTGELNLAFVLPEDLDFTNQAIDISIEGPRDYLLDRVKGEFKPDFNVFSWNSEVVEGLDIAVDDLEPCVSLLGETYIPSFLSHGVPTGMPEIAYYRVLLETNIDGNLKCFAKDLDQFIIEEEYPVSAQIPIEVMVPATSTSSLTNLYVVMNYETENGPRTVRARFPIQTLKRELAQGGEQ